MVGLTKLTREEAIAFYRSSDRAIKCTKTGLVHAMHTETNQLLSVQGSADNKQYNLWDMSIPRVQECNDLDIIFDPNSQLYLKNHVQILK